MLDMSRWAHDRSRDIEHEAGTGNASPRILLHFYELYRGWQDHVTTEGQGISTGLVLLLLHLYFMMALNAPPATNNRVPPLV